MKSRRVARRFFFVFFFFPSRLVVGSLACFNTGRVGDWAEHGQASTKAPPCDGRGREGSEGCVTSAIYPVVVVDGNGGMGWKAGSFHSVQMPVPILMSGVGGSKGSIAIFTNYCYYYHYYLLTTAPAYRLASPGPLIRRCSPAEPKQRLTTNGNGWLNITKEAARALLPSIYHDASVVALRNL